jgi:hypothetical protein
MKRAKVDVVKKAPRVKEPKVKSMGKAPPKLASARRLRSKKAV